VTYVKCSCLWLCLAAGRVWKVLLDPVSDSRPYTITATLLASPSHMVQLRDVLFGDVWLCVGQNKLHHSVARVFVVSVYLGRVKLLSAAVLFKGTKESWRLARKILSQFKLLWFLNVFGNTLLSTLHFEIAKKTFLLPAALSNLTLPV